MDQAFTSNGQWFSTDLPISSKNNVASKKGTVDCFLSVFFFNHCDQIMGKCPVRFAHKKMYLIFYLSQIIDDAQILRKFNRLCP